MSASSAIITPKKVRDHFGSAENVIIIDVGRRSTSAWVRERWDGHHLGAEATVWGDHVAIVASDEATDRILREAPDHWVETVDRP